MKSEAEVRQMLAILIAFDTEGGQDLRSMHGKEIRAIQWVLDEYPRKPQPLPENNP